jgi:hypothetical protein
VIIGTSHSVNNVPIRLTEQRWNHIVESHPELSSLRELVLEAVEEPDYILRSRRGALTAVVFLGHEAFLHVFYIEKSRYDGFIVTARVGLRLDRSKIIWRKDDD